MIDKCLENPNKKRRVSVKRKRAGFTLIELLVSMAIMLLFTVIMTALMNTATLAYEKSVKCSNADVFVSNAVNKLRSELSDARNVKPVSSDDFSNETIQAKYGIAGYTFSKGIYYTDASTGAECMIFYGKEGSAEDNLYVSKYGEVNPLVFTTDDLSVSISDITISGKTVKFTSLSAMSGGETYSTLSEMSVKLQ